MTYGFTFESPLILEETLKDHVIVEACILKEGVSRKGHWYTVEDTDFNLVAETAVGKSIYFGTDWQGGHDAPPIRGTYLKGGPSTYSGRPPIGKVLSTYFNKATRKVMAKLKIWEPSLVERIRRGFKVSIRGIFDNFKRLFRKGREVIKVIGLKIKDIQLVPPEANVGVAGAEVTKVLAETMEFNTQFVDDWEVDAVVAKLVADGVIV